MRIAFLVASWLAFAPDSLLAQSQDAALPRGAAALSEAVDALAVTTRVLMIGAHPDDEDTRFITWLARGRHVETAYLSLTRGDGGQNLIGNELGEALGVIRTEELLAARRIDGARQYFTRAYDFGFSRSADETWRHWPHDTLLGDVVRVVRATRPHVIVAVFSGTERDGHGHHWVSGLLAREVYDVAGDTVRFPAAAFGPAWTVPKFYRNRTYWRHEGATYRYDAGEFDPVLGMSYAEIAGRSRSQHKSQAFGSLEPKGAIVGSVLREATRVNESAPATDERGIFDGIDTTWARFRAQVSEPSRRRALDALPAAIAAVRTAHDVRRPEAMLPALARAEEVLERDLCGRDPAPAPRGPSPCDDGVAAPDLAATRRTLIQRLHRAIQLAAGIELEATLPREELAEGRPAVATVTVHNRGTRPARVETMQLEGTDGAPELLGGTAVAVTPGASIVRTGIIVPGAPTQPWWLARPRAGDLFDIGDGARTPEEYRYSGAVDVIARVVVDEAWTVAEAPVVRRFADPIRGEVTRPAVSVPVVSLALDAAVAYVRARERITRAIRVHVRSADTVARTVVVRLVLPAGLVADSAGRRVTLGAGGRATVTFQVSGQLDAPVRYRVLATAEGDGATFAGGYVDVDYDHIRPMRLYRPAALELQAVAVVVPARLRVAYVPGVGDNVAPTLTQLGVATTVVPADAVGTVDFSAFTTVVIGPRAYEASAALRAANPRLLDWARGGGTLVVQYQQDIAQPGRAPFALALAPRADRVTVEDAPVTILAPQHRLLTAPNRITDIDFADWVQERTTYMPRTFDAAYTPLLEMADPGEPASRGALLVAPLGRGTYVLTTLAFFRQLPAGNPGAARLFVNLLSAGLAGP